MSIDKIIDMSNKMSRKNKNKEAKKFDQGKPDLSLLPREALERISEVMQYGADKYGRDNWRQGMDFTRLSSATLRHLYAWIEGETEDPESGLNHLAHSACSLMFLIHLTKTKAECDNRIKGSK